MAEIVRSVFIPDPDHEWLCADYRQFEFRWFAHFAQNPALLEAYRNDPDTDFHGIISNLTGLPRNADEAMQRGIRGNAKQVNLGLVFGMGEGRMAMEMGLPYTVELDSDSGKEWLRAGPEAKVVFQKYHEAVPGVKTFLEKASSVARSRGYVKTVMGRHLRFPNGYFTHKAGGLILQGSAADALKVKMIELALLQGVPMRLMLSVHDEMNLSKYMGADSKWVIKAVKEVMEDFGPTSRVSMRVPVRTDPRLGDNWWIASKG